MMNHKYESKDELIYASFEALHRYPNRLFTELQIIYIHRDNYYRD